MESLLHVVLSNTAFACAVGVIAFAVQRIGRSPQLAHALWLLVLIKLVTPPLYSFDLPGAFRAPAGHRTTSIGTAAADQPMLSFDRGELSAPSIPVVEQATDPLPDRPVADASPSTMPARSIAAHDFERPAAASRLQAVGWQTGLWMVWVGGGVLGAALLWRRLRRFKLLVANAVEADPALVAEVRALAERMQIGRVPAVRVLDAHVPPLVYAGWQHLTLLIPARLLDELSPQQIETVIIHELAHVRRRDHWTRWFETGVRLLLWWHPLVWWAGRQLRLAEEECCDAWVAQMLPENRRSYGQALLWTVDFLAEDRPAFPVAGTTLGGSHVKRRIERIMTQTENRRMTARALLAVIVLGAGILPVAAQQQPDDAPAPPKSDVVTSAPPADPGSAPNEEETSAAIHVAAGESIQAAIDAAAEGSTIALAEGVFRERIRVTKPLTLAGAGWDKTRLQPEGSVEIPNDATITVSDTKGVAFRGLKVTVSATDRTVSTEMAARGGVGGAAAVRINGAGVSISDTVVVGPCGFGVVVANGSLLDISDTLVAAVWGTGVAVEGARGRAGPSTLHMRGCVVRNCYHRCVTLGPGCDSSVIERSLISGSAWHGIRYDDASPLIRQNVIFGNARCGIYESGTTAANVRRNLFMKNEMGGMWCWFANSDAIEANIFVENAREALAIVGQSTPRVENNWFQGGPLAVSYGKIKGQEDRPRSAEPILDGNIFAGIDDPLKIDGERRVLTSSNRHVPAVDVAWDLSQFGPLDTEAGAKVYTQEDGFQSLCMKSRWPEPLPEELAIIPEGETRDYRAWNKGSPAESAGPVSTRFGLSGRSGQDRLQSAREAVQPWLDDAFQIDSVEKREAAVEKVRAALKSANDDDRRQGLVAFTQMAAIRFDKASFHDLFVPLLESADPQLRLLAAQSLVAAGVQTGDVERLIALADDPDSHMRETIASLIVAALEKDLTSPSAADAVLGLLSDDDRIVQDATIRSLWGARFSPELEARIIDLSREPRGSYNALYYALSTQPTKSEASVSRLIEFLSDRDTHNVGGRAAWGLGYGVAAEQQELVAEAALKVVAARSEGYLFQEAMKRLKQYAGPEQVPAMRALLAKPGVDGDLRTGLEAAVQAAESR